MPPEQDELLTPDAPAAASAPEPVSLRAGLEAAFAADAAKSGASTEIKPATIPDPDASAPEAKAAPARDEAGKFAPKPAETEAPKPVTAETKTTDSPQAAAPEAPKEPIQPPAALSASAKAKWATLDPAMQAEWSKREADMVQGMQKQGDQLKSLQSISEAIDPHRNYLALNKMDPGTYVRALVAADELLRGPNPLGALGQIASTYNIDLRQLGQPSQGAQPGQQPAQQAQQDPALQQALQRVAALEQSQVQQQTLSQQTEQSRLQAQIDTFGRDNVYFENVRQPMAALLRSPALAAMAETNPIEAMKIAYDQACWASPEVRPILMKDQADKAAAAQRAADSAKASEARQASGSVTGSPTPGASPARTGPSPSIRESLERQFGAAV